ncbi:DUF3641 domain-containing protein, partial [bacterium]
MIPFSETLAVSGLELRRAKPLVLQVNTGTYCNMLCRHCHHDAGPHRAAETMGEGTAREVISFARRGAFAVADITGGAPELSPVLPLLVEGLSSACPKVVLRSNLTALAGANGSELA